MSESLQDLDRRIESANELHSITRTMRGLAAVNLHHHERAASAVSAYEAIVADGLQAALREGRLEQIPTAEPAIAAPTALIVFGSNQGLCGPINRYVAARAVEEAANWPTLARVAAVGARLATELAIAGLEPAVNWDLPGSVEGIPPRAESVLLRADRWRIEQRIERVVLVFPNYVGRTRGYEPTALQLSPTDHRWLKRLASRTWRSRSLPTFTMAWDRLVAELLREAMLVHLHRSFAQTMASVAASRLAAMDAAQHDIEERLERLRFQHQQQRQTQITEELLDVVSGFEVLRQSG
jgi:F-type H+-transporting ATPase subunit gamma